MRCLLCFSLMHFRAGCVDACDTDVAWCLCVMTRNTGMSCSTCVPDAYICVHMQVSGVSSSHICEVCGSPDEAEKMLLCDRFDGSQCDALVRCQCDARARDGRVMPLCEMLLCDRHARRHACMLHTGVTTATTSTASRHRCHTSHRASGSAPGASRRCATWNAKARRPPPSGGGAWTRGAAPARMPGKGAKATATSPAPVAAAMGAERIGRRLC